MIVTTFIFIDDIYLQLKEMIPISIFMPTVKILKF